MASFEGEGARTIDKINGENFNLWKYKLEMRLDSVDLWGIVDKFEAILFLNVDSKVKKVNQRLIKK